MFFNSVEQINRLRKEMNTLLNTEMSNIYLKVTIEKKWHTQNFDFIGSKSSSPGQFLESSNSRRYHWIFKLLVATWKSDVQEQNCLWLFYSQRVYAFCWKNLNFNENDTESKIEIPHTVLERWTFLLQLV